MQYPVLLFLPLTSFLVWLQFTASPPVRGKKKWGRPVGGYTARTAFASLGVGKRKKESTEIPDCFHFVLVWGAAIMPFTEPDRLYRRECDDKKLSYLVLTD